VVFVAAVFLTDAADGIARELNVTGGVVGVVGVVFATSLPEVVTSIAALRKGAAGSWWATSSAATCSIWP